MKTVVKSVLLGLSLFATFVALLIVSASSVQARPMAKDKKVITSVRHVAYAANSGRVINVNVEKPAGEALRIAFVSKQGDVLAQQYIGKQSGAYSAKFNVAQLPDGQYQVRIFGKELMGEYKFTLKTPEQTVSRTLSLQ